MTVARLWIASIDDARAEDYERFAREVSLPMFRRQPGFEGALMFRSGGDCAVLTLWGSDAEANALLESPLYQGTVAEIQNLGLLTGSQNVELFDVHLADLAGFGAPPAGA